MAILPHLAMTAAEFAGCESLPPKLGWMACHFSPYSTGLSNLPDTLPKGAMLIVNDSTPIFQHNPETITDQLLLLTQKFQCSGVLLDFQRKADAPTMSLAKFLCEKLPCPTGVSEALASISSGPIFLPPCPLYTPLEEYLHPWKNREIWLEIALEEAEIHITDKGSKYTLHPTVDTHTADFADSALHCHYEIHADSKQVCFTLWRTASDLKEHLLEAESLGITQTVGLYQEFKDIL